MKVGLTATMIQGGKSGVGQYVLSLARQLMERERLELTLFVREEERPLFGFAEGKARIENVAKTYAGPLRDILWHQCVLPRKAKQLGLDVLHVPSYRRLLAHAPCPVVGTIHDLAPFHLAEKYDPLRMFYGQVVVKALARRQDHVIAVSEFTATDLQRFYGLTPDSITTIPNGIDHHRFFPGDRASSRETVAHRHGQTHPYLLYVSRLEHPGKNHVRLIEAFARFKAETGSDWQLLLGGGDWHGAEVIKQAASESPVAQDIRFLGFVPDQDMGDLYRGAEAMIYPSLFEGFGLPPAEAMACGTPVISSTRGALGEVVRDAALTVDPESVPELASSLMRLAKDRALREDLRRKGPERAAAYRWEQTARDVERVYHRVIRPGKGQGVRSRGADIRRSPVTPS